MHDAAVAVRGFQAELESAVGPTVKGDAPAGQVFDGAGGSGSDALDHRSITQFGARSDGIGRMQSRVIVRSDSRGDATLCPGAGRAQGEWRLGEHDDGLGREMQGGQQSCESGTDDDRLARKRVSNLLHGEFSEGGSQIASMRSTARRARAATSGWIVTSGPMVSSAWRIFRSVIRFMCGQRLHGRTNSISGCWTARLSLIEHSVTNTTCRGLLSAT